MNVIEVTPSTFTSCHIAIVVSQFNQAVTDKLLDGALTRWHALGYSQAQLTVVKVPGAVEIPLTALKLAKQKSYDAIIALGAVIRGETGHYDYVCQQVSDGCMQVSLDYEIPVVFGILTTDNGQQALARAGGEHSDKGSESIDCALSMVQTIEKINQLAQR